MRGVNLNAFDFDYDLTWAAFFVNGQSAIYGRYGGRDAGSPDKYLTLSGLKYAMREALAAYQREPKRKPAKDLMPSRTVEHYDAAKGLKGNACIHCHQVYDFRREERIASGKWRLDEVWVYPLPDNVGLVLDPQQGSQVKSVKPGSSAERAGLRAGDQLRHCNGESVVSFADVQHAFNQAPATGSIRVSWQRDAELLTADLELRPGWRTTDIGWRASMWGLEPTPHVFGQDLSASEKKELDLPERGMAFRQDQYVPGPAKDAGVRPKDIIFGIDGKQLEMTALQFNVYVRLNHKVGDRVTFNLLRDGKKLNVPMTLKGRP
jgi:hypothetical protein